mmetsp:Transcript_18550/g.37790  ORF Transcript_18550/g.37790 Transcript_18550/m.37790 type:complete len:212 (-) Transcript_18550:546-1181(-)
MRMRMSKRLMKHLASRQAPSNTKPTSPPAPPTAALVRPPRFRTRSRKPTLSVCVCTGGLPTCPSPSRSMPVARSMRSLRSCSNSPDGAGNRSGGSAETPVPGAIIRRSVSAKFISSVAARCSTSCGQFARIPARTKRSPGSLAHFAMNARTVTTSDVRSSFTTRSGAVEKPYRTSRSSSARSSCSESTIPGTWPRVKSSYPSTTAPESAFR